MELLNYNELIQFQLNHIDLEMSSFKKVLMTEAYPKHYHGSRTLEIHYVIDGEAEVIIKNQRFKVKKGFVYAVNEFSRHGQIPTTEDGLLKYQIYLTYDDTRASQLEKKFIEEPFFLFEDKENVKEIFELIENEFKNKHIGYIDSIKAFLQVLLIKMLRNLNIDNRRLDLKTNKNTQFIIDEAFLNENATITLTLLSKRLNMSSRELERFLKIHYNKTFNQMKTEARMFAASGLLVYSDKSINEISIIAGYTSPEHFCYAFKKFYKHTPNEYRKLRRSLRNREPGTF